MRILCGRRLTRASGHIFVVLLLAITILAILLGRFVPVVEVKRSARVAAPVFAPAHRVGHRSDGQFLDSDTGRPGDLEGIDARSIQQATVAPWVTEAGESELISFRASWETCLLSGGHWLRLSLVRQAIPGGEVLRTVDLGNEQSPPSGPLCWSSAVAPGVVFAGEDGCLYRCAMGEAEDSRFVPRWSSRIQPVTWSQAPAGVTVIHLIDPSRPTDPRLAGMMVVSASLGRPDEKGRIVSTYELMWLRLNVTGSVVREWGTLARLDGRGQTNAGPVARLPVIATGADGGLFLAYFRVTGDSTSKELHVAPVELDPETGHPRARLDEVRALAEGCLPVPPAISSDGRTIRVLARDGTERARVIRLAAPERVAAGAEGTGD